MKDYKKDYPLDLQKTKVGELDKKFNLSDAEERKKYFQAKVGDEIARLKEYFEENTFIAYWLGKKNAGKGTYSKLMMEIFGKDKIGHISIGDVVRDVHSLMDDKKAKKEIMEYLAEHYRGYISVDDAIKAFLNRDTKTLLPTEFILTLVKREIDKMPKKILFIDGFPRELDQISYSLYFRDLIDYRQDKDIFIAIDIPESVIDERMKYRVVCPTCKSPRNLKLFTTKEVGYDMEEKVFYLICDNTECEKRERMSAKEGDNLGIEEIRERLELDDRLIEKVFSLHGVPKILLRNSVPVERTEELVDQYEITPEYVYELEGEKVKTKEKAWIIKDDEGVDSYSLLAPPVVVSLIKQLAKILLS